MAPFLITSMTEKFKTWKMIINKNTIKLIRIKKKPKRLNFAFEPYNEKQGFLPMQKT